MDMDQMARTGTDWTFSRHLPMPGEAFETPCFVILESGVIANLDASCAAVGGAARFMPHVKTHRAPWIVGLSIEKGVTAFKAATVAEAEMVAECGAETVTLAYPTVNPANVRRFVRAAGEHSGARFVTLVDSPHGLSVWKQELRDAPANLSIRVDLDAGMGRTGAPMDERAFEFARELAAIDRFAGWHLYDGHVKGSREERAQAVAAEAAGVEALNARLAEIGIAGDLVAGGSYTFDLWPAELARWVSPGSWTFSSSQHDAELPELHWQPAAFVLATVTSAHDGTVTLDAGAKAIAPDKPMRERFLCDGEIVLMSEEHSVVRAEGLAVGDRVLLQPRHACTTAYLYDRALVRTREGEWSYRPQLGNAR